MSLPSLPYNVSSPSPELIVSPELCVPVISSLEVDPVTFSACPKLVPSIIITSDPTTNELSNVNDDKSIVCALGMSSMESVLDPDLDKM